MKTRAAVAFGPGKPLEIVEVSAILMSLLYQGMIPREPFRLFWVMRGPA
jgi:hypothetical protein